MRSQYSTPFAQALLTCNEQTEWEINEIYVIKSFRGRGHGRELLQMICEDADLEGVRLTLEVCALDEVPVMDDDALLHWYERCGFRRYGIGLTKFIMMSREPRGARIAA